MIRLGQLPVILTIGEKEDKDGLQRYPGDHAGL